MSSSQRRARALEEDLQSALLLNPLIDFWGLPSARRSYERGDEPCVDVYWFPGEDDSPVARVVSVGASSALRALGSERRFEILFVLPPDLGEAEFSTVADYMMELVAAALAHPGEFDVGFVVGESSAAPEQWEARGLIINEPTGEAEELEQLPGIDGEVTLLWAIPAYQSECALVRNDGIEAFDDLIQQAEWSPAEPRRDPYIE